MATTLNDQPQLELQNRLQEESRIVAKWLDRLEECLADHFPGLFEKAIRQARLSREQLGNAVGLTHEHFDLAIEYARRECRDINFRLISKLELLDLGILGYAVLSCPTVGKGLAMMARYQELTSDRFTEQHVIEGSFHLIRPLRTWRYMREEESIAEDCIAGNWQAIGLMMGAARDYQSAGAYFAYKPPAHHAVYEEFFSPCPVHFNAERTELKIPTDWLQNPITSANITVSDVTAAVCERLLGPGRNTRVDTTRTVRRLLLNRPGQRMLRLEEAADELHMSTAQLRKRLYRAGTSYKNIVLEIRMTLARHYLESTHLSVQEIAYLLDYAQPGPFSRAFKKYTGNSPITVRGQSQPHGETL